jgi:hypothetical protein
MSPGQNWRPGRLLRLSAAVHLVALALTVARLDLWSWALVAVIGNHLLLAVIGLWPRSTWLGPEHHAAADGAMARAKWQPQSTTDPTPR